MRFKLNCLAFITASLCLFHFSACAQPITVPGTYKHITIDGSFGDWAGVPLATNKAQIAGDVVEFQNLYVANDENFLYLRFSLYTAANPFTSKQNIFIDRDANGLTGLNENGLGSEMLIQGGSAFRETNGVFNSSPISNLGWQASPAAPATQYEVRISRTATYTNGTFVLTNNTIGVVLETGETGGNRFFPATTGGLLYTFATPPPVLSNNVTLIDPAASSWQVDGSGTDQGTGWLDQAYDDSQPPWAPGLGLFGYTPDTGAYPTIQTPLTGGPSTFYFRTHFNWTNNAANVAFVVTNYLSDGAVYYLNGAEVKRVRMAAGAVAYGNNATGTNSPEGSVGVFGISGTPLAFGDNIFEVETHQAVGSDADMVFGMSLTAAAQFAVTIMDPNLPADTNVLAGQSATFTSDVLGGGVLSYQWSKNGVNILNATNSTLTIPSVLTNDAGSYALRIANTISTNTTRSALLTVATTPVVFVDSTQPADQYIVQGRPVTMSVFASGSAPVTYQWYQGANAIANATNASYSIAAVDPTNGGGYYAMVSNTVGSTNSRTALLTVLRDTVPPAVTNAAASPQQIIITFSEPVDLASAANPANYTLSGGASVSGAVLNGQTVTLSVSSPLTLGTTYSLAINGVKDIFGNAAHITLYVVPTIIIDGNMSDWAGITPIYSGASGSDGAADFKDIYVYNDASYYYFRTTLWHDIPSASGFFPKFCNLFFNTDNDPNTGYSAIGSEFLDQSGFFYQERGGTFSSEGQVLGNMAAGYLISPTVRESSFPADFEFRLPLNATFSDGAPVFTTNVISFLWQGQTPGFVALNTAPASGVITYTNVVPTIVPTLPPSQLSISSVPGGNVALVWDTGTLQYDSSLGNGSWTNLPAATSPYIIPAAGGQQFFRLIK